MGSQILPSTGGGDLGSLLRSVCARVFVCLSGTF